MDINQYLQKYRLITDGSFGTYYADKFSTDEMPELANTNVENSQRVFTIHKEYIEAGAKMIRTNTFASNTVLLNADLDAVKENIKAAAGIAKRACQKVQEPLFIAGDIGPIPIDDTDVTDIDPVTVEEQYYQIAKTFMEEDIRILTFETFSDLMHILPAIKRVKAECLNEEKSLFIMVQFRMNQFGYSAGGLSAGKLLAKAASEPEIDAVGLNCGVGPGHMEQILRSLGCLHDKYMIALPNAGYPERVRNRIRFASRPDYFADKAELLVNQEGVDIIGGCCGTTPEFIRILSQRLNLTQQSGKRAKNNVGTVNSTVQSHAFFGDKISTDRKLIAVELAPPANANDEKVLAAAHLLKRLDVDVVTFPDSPSGRMRADSVLMAEKVHRETGLCVMPHVCCRDKNALAMRSMLLGAHINEIQNLLIITGDPVPSMERQTIKAVFNFDSVGLMRIVCNMNEENFHEAPMTYGGAINQGRINLEVEVGRIKKKLEAGAEFFFTQPVFSQEDADRLRRMKQETGARILCGIMPLISRRNALFMKNETGIIIPDDVVERYSEGFTREEGEQVGIALAKEVIAYTLDFADGYYFSFPFNRVHMLKAIRNDLSCF